MEDDSPAGDAGRAGQRWLAGAAAVGWLLLGARAAYGESWTNVLGHAIEARFVECVGRSVMLRQADGSLVRVPLASLCASDRRRIEALAPFKPGGRRPASSAEPADEAVSRAKALHAAGRLSDADLALVMQAFKARLRDESR